MLKRLAPFLPCVIMIACISMGGVSPADQTAVVQTLTATVWTPTPPTASPTPEPNLIAIIEILNNAMVGSDPLAETIKAKFSIIDARILMDGAANLAGILQLSIECEWIFSDSCTLEETFVVLMRALTADDKVTGKIIEQVPLTVHTLQMVAFDHMLQTGMIAVNWQDVMDYAAGRINGNQLGARIIRYAASP
jgi:hypothetical protein